MGKNKCSQKQFGALFWFSVSVLKLIVSILQNNHSTLRYSLVPKTLTQLFLIHLEVLFKVVTPLVHIVPYRDTYFTLNLHYIFYNNYVLVERV